MDDRSEDGVEELERLVRGWAEAERRGDTASLRDALVEDFVGIGPHGFVLDKEQWLERYAPGGLRHDDFRFDETLVRLYGGAAVVTGRQTQSSEYRGRDAGGRFRGTLVFGWRRDRWLLANVHLSPIAAGAGS